MVGVQRRVTKRSTNSLQAGDQGDLIGPGIKPDILLLDEVLAVEVCHSQKIYYENGIH